MRGKAAPAVLFIGNSYSFGAPGAFGKLARQRGREVLVAQVTHGGWTLAQHASDAATLRKIREHHWDVIVLQEMSRMPSLPIRRTLVMFPAVAKLAKEARSQGAVPILYQTWGYRMGDPKLLHDDFHAMTRRIREGYSLAAINSGGLWVVPVGDAWEREVSAGRGGELFMPDSSHPTAYGNRVTADAFFHAMFGN